MQQHESKDPGLGKLLYYTPAGKMPVSLVENQTGVNLSGTRLHLAD
ncbi:MAG: hypothetical protein K2W95_26130 [Candidatus Obscuribacterales bacterium]|nr:hypothetical protein [Candidatus Obscuribacterales bacterium]